MFHNIFEKKSKRINSTKQKKRPIITADIHEKNSLVISNIFSNKSINLEIKHLQVGDYIISDIIIERKTISDLYSSLISKRLHKQINDLKSTKTPLILIEGKNNNIIENKIYKGLILSIITKHKIPIIFTENETDTADYLITLANKQQKTNTLQTFHSKIPKTISEQKKYILESFPYIGPKSAQQLLNQFKSLKKIFNANEKQLKPVLKNHTTNFKKILSYPS